MPKERVYVKTDRISRKVAKRLESLTNTQIRRRASKIFRQALVEVLSKRRDTKKLAGRIHELRVQTKARIKVSVGSGRKFSISATGRIRSGVALTKRFMENVDDYYVLMTAQYGRKGLPARPPKKPYPMSMRKSEVWASYKKRHKHLHPYTGTNTRRQDGYVAVFTTGPIRPVAPWFKWMDMAHETLVEKFTAMVKEIKHG